MKTCIFAIISAVFFLAVLSGGSVSAPALPAGRPKEIASFQAHRFHVQGLAFSPDGKTLASGGRDGKVKLWDVATGKNTAEFQAHSRDARGARGMVAGVAFSPNGKTLATCGDDRTVRLWDVATGTNTVTFHRVTVPPAPPLAFSPDGKMLICDDQLFDLARKTDRPIIERSMSFRFWAAFDPNGKLLIASSNGGWPDPPCFWLWDEKTGKKMHTCEGKVKDKLICCVGFSRDGKTAISNDGWYMIRLWDTVTGKNTASFEQKDMPCDPTLSPDGKVLIFSCRPAPDRNDYPGSLRLLEVSSGKVLANLKGHEKLVSCIALSRDGQLLASGDLSGVIKIWKLPARYKAD
ncbi:MAG TPA: WD40 repeat domain-containing protein [Gemmataceae bacterium]|jgi:WD40 repeat protein